MICIVIVERAGDDEAQFQQDVAASVQNVDADAVYVSRPTDNVLTHGYLNKLYHGWYRAMRGEGGTNGERGGGRNG